jgi:glucose/arabinose dehydrogenase
MKLRQTFALGLALAALAGAACGGAEVEKQSPSRLVAIGAGIQGPAGLAASVYTAGPRNVAAMAFDGEGRLWLGTAAFEDSGTDGVWFVGAKGGPPVQVLAEMHTVLGLLWHGSTLFVASHGGVDAFSGFDGVTFTESSTILSLPDDAGEVNGLALGPDGRLRLGISAPCDHCQPEADFSGAVISFGRDGSAPEVEASGIRAPIGLAYVPGSGELLVTMNHRDDLESATPGDWLAVVARGQDWGFPGCYGQGGDVCANTPQPIVELDPHAAVAGVAIVGDELSASIGESAIVAQWANGKVMIVSLNRDGGRLTGTAAPFLTGIEAPVAVSATPSGSVLVGDWKSGTIYEVRAG